MITTSFTWKQNPPPSAGIDLRILLVDSGSYYHKTSIMWLTSASCFLLHSFASVALSGSRNYSACWSNSLISSAWHFNIIPGLFGMAPRASYCCFFTTTQHKIQIYVGTALWSPCNKDEASRPIVKRPSVIKSLKCFPCIQSLFLCTASLGLTCCKNELKK